MIDAHFLESVSALRNKCYSLDTWLWYDISICFHKIPILRHIKHIQLQHISLALMRQTILGVVLFIKYADQQSKEHNKKSFLLDILDEIIIREVRLLPFSAMRPLSLLYRDMIVEYDELLDLLLKEPETQNMCSLVYSNFLDLLKRCEGKDMIGIGHEDIIWLRELFKHIQYFSKKSYIPKH